MVSIRTSTRNPDGDAGHSARRPGILLMAHMEFAVGPGKCQPDSCAGNRTRIRSPAEGARPGPIRVVTYLPFSASYCAMTSPEMRPRSLTSKPRSLAQLRISLFLLSLAAVFRTRGGRPAEPVTLRAALM